MSTTQELEPVTDVNEYLTNFPEYRECRADRHDWHKLFGGSWLSTQDDRTATHQKVAECTRCGMVRRKRCRAEIRRGKLRSMVKLNPVYDRSKCPNFGAHGVRITSTVVDEWEMRQLVETVQRKR